MNQSSIRLGCLLFYFLTSLCVSSATSTMSQTTFDGAINEKPRLQKKIAFNNNNPRSHLMHAIEGLDRYPNYLSRWSEDDILQLEQSLEDQLQQVRTQRQQIQESRQRLSKLVHQVCQQNPEFRNLLQAPETWQQVKDEILDARASNAIFRSKTFLQQKTNTTTTTTTTTIPSVQDVISGDCRIDLNVGHLEVLMEEEMFDVYSFPLLARKFCERVSRFIQAVNQHAEQHNNKATTAASINGIRDLDNLGLQWLNDLIFQLVLRPISRHLHQETETKGGDLDWRQGYIAAYSANPTDDKRRRRQRLVPHTDDSEVTMNIGMGDKFFQGGNLNFWGLRGTNLAGTLVGEYKPQIGRAMVHSGRNLHEVTTVTKGNRFAYILWARSWTGVRAETCPCCWLNRRDNDKSPCICGPKWN